MKSMNSTAERTNDGDVLRILVEQAPVGVCIMQDGKFCYVNSYFPVAIGYTVDELIGKDSLEIVIPEDRKMVKERTTKMLSGELPSPYQFRVIRKDGGIVWVMATVKSVQYHGRKAILGNYMEVTGRKQVEDALKESEERYRELANSITDVFFAMDEHLRYTYWNKASEALTGIRGEDAIGKSLGEIFPDKPWRRRAEKVYRSVLRTQQPQTFVNDYDIDGRRYIFEISAYPSKNGVSVFVRDITEHKQAEDARREAEEEKSALLEEAPVNIVHTDLKGKITYVNQRFESESGYSREEVIGKNGFALDWFSAGTLEVLTKRMVARLRGSRAKHWETRFKCKDGRWIWVELEGKVLRRSGVPVGFQIIATNTTERKQMEEALRQSEERYRALFDRSLDCVYVHDFQGNFLDANNAALKLLGYEKKDISHLNFASLLSEEQLPRAIATLQELKDTGTQKHVNEFRLRCKDGSFVDVDVISAVIYHNGKPYAIQGVGRDVTERKRAEEALRRSEERYRTVLDEMENGYYEQDLAGNFTIVNDAMCRLLGYSRDELMGMDYRVYTPEEDVERRYAVWNKIHRTGESVKWLPLANIRKDGTRIFVEDSILPLRDVEGKIIGFRGVSRDITQRKQAEEARQKSEERYRVLAENAGEAILVVQDDVVKFINPKGLELSRYSTEELVSRPFVEFIHPDDIDMVADRYVRRLKGEAVPQVYDFRIVRKDGDIRWGELNAVPISWEDRPAVLCFMNDVTERRQMEEALTRSEGRYRTMLEEMEEGYYEVDIVGNFTFVNDAMSQILGYSRDELLGMNYKAYTPEEDIKTIFEAYNRVYRTGEPLKWFPMVEVRRDGTRVLVEDSVLPMRDDKGEVIGFRGVSRDVTEHRRAEEALRQSEERYRTILEDMEDAYFEVDLGGHLTFINSSLCRDLGYSKEELMGKSYKDFTAQEDTESVFGAFNEVYQTGLPNKGFAWKTVRKDGVHGFAETSISLLKNDEGATVGFRGVGRDIAERKKAEEALSIQRAYFQQLFDTSPDAIIMTDTKDRAIQVNKGFERLFGYHDEETRGRSLVELIVPEEDAQQASKSLERILRGETIRKEAVRRRRDGSLVDVSILAYPIHSNGKLIGAYGIYTDITERKRQEQALTDEATRRRILLDQSRDGIVVLDQDGKVYEANQRFAEMLGYTPEEIRELSVWDWEYLSPHERVLEMIRTVDEAGDHFDTQHRRKDGSICDVEISTNGVIFAGQKLIFCVCRDVTERKQAEKALRESNERYRALFDNSVTGTLVVDAETMKVVMANQAAAKMFGFSSAEAVPGLDLSEVIHAEDKEEVSALATKSLFEQNSHPTHNLRATTRDGREIWISASGAKIMHEGKLAGLISFADITEQKQQNGRLMMADRLASIGELAAGAAHELNNPLTSIIGFSELLMERDTPDHIRKDLALIHNEAQRAANVTSNLLTFARKHTPARQLTQVNDVVEDVLKLRAYGHKSNCIEVERHLAPDLPEIAVDRFQIQQVFLNIIMNAEYFMVNAHNRGSLTITTEEQNGAVVILFTDDGLGIPPENLTRIFHPFFTTKEAGKGTGLGLSICHGIVAAHGGHIYAKSQPGEGATIVVELPVNGG